MTAEKHENNQILEKIAARKEVLASFGEPPRILECCAGEGILYLHCYQDLPPGWAIEQKSDLINGLTRQRPGWLIFEGNAEDILAAAPNYFNADLFDVDPFGSPWPIYASLFTPGRLKKKRFALVAHDGSRRFLSIGAGGANDQRWKKGLLLEIAREHGDNLETISHGYLEVAQDKLIQLGQSCGYNMVAWKGLYSGKDSHSSHYATIFES